MENNDPNEDKKNTSPFDVITDAIVELPSLAGESISKLVKYSSKSESPLTDSNVADGCSQLLDSVQDVASKSFEFAADSVVTAASAITDGIGEILGEVAANIDL